MSKGVIQKLEAKWLESVLEMPVAKVLSGTDGFRLYTIVMSAIVQCIHDHGPITESSLNSLRKRLIGALETYNMNAGGEGRSQRIARKIREKKEKYEAYGSCVGTSG